MVFLVYRMLAERRVHRSVSKHLFHDNRYLGMHKDRPHDDLYQKYSTLKYFCGEGGVITGSPLPHFLRHKSTRSSTVDV